MLTFGWGSRMETLRPEGISTGCHEELKKMQVGLGSARPEIMPGHPKLPGNSTPFPPYKCITMHQKCEVQI